MKLVTVIDYKAGNLASVVKALRSVGAEVEVTSDPEAVEHKSHVVLPGVGNFGATAVLTESGMREAVATAIAQGAYFLGICVGHQWLFEGSTESESTAGMGLFRGQCSKFPPEVKSPHVGWNTLMDVQPSKLLRGVEPGSYVYYSHSFRAPKVREWIAESEYGGVFTAAAESGNVMGVQFHPEKSGEVGQRILENFVGMGGPR